MYPYYNSQQYPMLQPGGINFAGTQGFQMANQMPSQQPPTNRSIIFGRPVNRVEDIAPNEVPMDGTSGYFPMVDDTAIYKLWNSNGTIRATKYVLEVTTDEEKAKSEIEELKSWLEDQFNNLRPHKGKEVVG